MVIMSDFVAASGEGWRTATVVGMERDEPGDDIVEVTIAAYGLGEHKVVVAPGAWRSRIEALSAVTQYGPNYQRRVVDTLGDLSHKVRSGYLELAEADLEYCERIAGTATR